MNNCYSECMTKSTICIDGHPDVQGNLVIEGEQRWSWRAEVPLRLDFGSEVWLTAAVGDHTYVGLARVTLATIDDRDRALARLEGMSLLAVLDAPGQGGLIPATVQDFDSVTPYLPAVRERAELLRVKGKGLDDVWMHVFAKDMDDMAGEVERLRAVASHAAMHASAYRSINRVLDKCLGPDEENGAGEGIVADVHLLGYRYELALKAIESAGGTVTADLIRNAQLPEPSDQGELDTRPNAPEGGEGQ